MILPAPAVTPVSRGFVVEGGTAAGLHDAAGESARLRKLGCDVFAASEVNHDPFLALAVAAAETAEIGLATSIAVAFARSPMTLAATAWDLQSFSGGRLVLGLGSQVKAHVERRYAMPWSRPAARMREYVQAVRAIWHSWQSGDELDFRGDFYSHTLMTPVFRPGPLSCDPPPVFVAAVGEQMTTAACEVADGIALHAFTTERYVREVTLPAVERVLTAHGRSREQFQIRATPFIIAESDPQRRADAVQRVRERIAFYGSTPAYRRILDVHGWGALHDDLLGLSKRGRWEEMGELVSDEVLETFAIVAEPSTLADRVRARWIGVADRISLALPPDSDDDWHASVVAALRTSGP